MQTNDVAKLRQIIEDLKEENSELKENLAVNK